MDVQGLVIGCRVICNTGRVHNWLHWNPVGFCHRRSLSVTHRNTHTHTFFIAVLPLYTVASELAGRRGSKAAMVTDECGSEWRGPDGYLATRLQSEWLHTRTSV